MRDAAELVLLAVLWGGSFLLMRIAAPEFGPVPLIAIRVAIGAACLAPLLIYRHGAAALLWNWKRVFFMGIINSAIPFSLLAYSTVYLSAGFTAILNAISPFFSAIIAWLWLSRRLSGLQVFGMVIGLAGVTVLVWDKLSFDGGGSAMAVVAAFFASMFYGLAANYTKARLPKGDPLVVAVGSQIGAAIFLLPFALWWAPPALPTAKAWGAAVILGVFSTGLAYILYFRLIENIGATPAIAVTFLIPPFAMAWGAAVLQEAVTLEMAAGTAIILAGTSLTTGLVRSGRVPG